MKYKFFENNGLFFYKPLGIIDFKILDEEYKDSYLDHLGGLSGDYIREIVKKMEEVRDGKLEAYDFGPQDSVIVDVFGQNYKDERYRGKTIISKAFTDIFIEIPFSEIYNLMKDYLEEIEKWEKKTGMKKPGW